MKHAVGLMALVAVTGCSSDYRPANSPRIAIGIQGSTHAYYKDGKEYPSGFFGGGAIDVVQGNPRAVAEARTGRDLTIAGFTFSMLGLGSLVTGLVVAANNNNDGLTTAESNTAVGFLIGAVASSLVGTILTFNAVPHFYDAIAIYNDGIPMQPVPMYNLQQPPPMYNPQAPPPMYNPQAPPPMYNPQAPPPAPQAPTPAPAVQPPHPS